MKNAKLKMRAVSIILFIIHYSLIIAPAQDVRLAWETLTTDSTGKVKTEVLTVKGYKDSILVYRMEVVSPGDTTAYIAEATAFVTAYELPAPVVVEYQTRTAIDTSICYTLSPGEILDLYGSYIMESCDEIVPSGVMMMAKEKEKKPKKIKITKGDAVIEGDGVKNGKDIDITKDKWKIKAKGKFSITSDEPMSIKIRYN